MADYIETLTAEDVAPVNEVLYSLCDMVLQFAYKSTYRRAEVLIDGGLSALELAFCVLEENGCKVNANGSISVKNLLKFMEILERKQNG